MTANHQAPDQPPIPCSLERFGRCRICELITPGSPDYREDYRRLFHPEEFPTEEAPAVAMAVAVIEPLPAASSPVAEALRLNALMHLCPWRSPDPGCGCAGLARCAVGYRGIGPVGHRDCYECLSGGQLSLDGTD